MGARAGVFVAFVARERVLLPRFSSRSSESGSGLVAFVERVRVSFGVCKDALDAILRIVFFSGSSVILAVKKGHSVPRFAILRRCSTLVTLAQMQLPTHERDIHRVVIWIPTTKFDAAVRAFGCVIARFVWGK